MTCCGKQDCHLELKTPFDQQKLLTIGMATYDDFDGVFFTTQAIIRYHPEILPYTEIIVVDNNPDGPCGKDTREYVSQTIKSTYISFSEYNSTCVRNLVFEHANTPFVLCTDSHVLFESGSLAKLLMYYQCNENTMDLIQGPLITDGKDSSYWTHFEPVWRSGMYGTWGIDKRGENRDGPAFDIPMQGLGVFTCRKDAWLGFNKNFRGFGGEEGYIHEKFRKHGRRTLCLPSLRWVHRFRRPLGPRYSVKWEDRIQNYYIGRLELGMKVNDITSHFMRDFKQFPESKIHELYQKALASYDK